MNQTQTERLLDKTRRPVGNRSLMDEQRDKRNLPSDYSVRPFSCKERWPYGLSPSPQACYG
jgi:hypothetical protein